MEDIVEIKITHVNNVLSGVSAEGIIEPHNYKLYIKIEDGLSIIEIWNHNKCLFSYGERGDLLTMLEKLKDKYLFSGLNKWNEFIAKLIDVAQDVLSLDIIEKSKYFFRTTTIVSS